MNIQLCDTRSLLPKGILNHAYGIRGFINICCNNPAKVVRPEIWDPGFERSCLVVVFGGFQNQALTMFLSEKKIVRVTVLVTILVLPLSLLFKRTIYVMKHEGEIDRWSKYRRTFSPDIKHFDMFHHVLYRIYAT